LKFDPIRPNARAMETELVKSRMRLIHNIPATRHVQSLLFV
jgi:hypothetical protein